MNSRELRFFLLLEIVAVAWAGMVFRIFDSRLIAGLMAGVFFVGSGLYILMRLWRWPARWRTLTFYPLVIHVFVISIPMLIVRFGQTETAFQDIDIMGVPGPIFHKISTNVFMVLMACTAVDLFRSRRKNNINK